jgi:hypothetical protein
VGGNDEVVSAEVILTHLGNDRGIWAAIDVAPGASRRPSAQVMSVSLRIGGHTMSRRFGMGGRPHACQAVAPRPRFERIRATRWRSAPCSSRGSA